MQLNIALGTIKIISASIFIQKPTASLHIFSLCMNIARHLPHELQSGAAGEAGEAGKDPWSWGRDQRFQTADSSGPATGYSAS